MKKINKISYAILTVVVPLLIMIISSCSQNVNGTIDLPYTEEIVIRGVLEAGQPVKGIMLSKTMPTLDTFTITQAEISNAEAYIMNNNIKYPLHFVGNALFDTDSLTAQSGQTYTLTVKWNGLTAQATTTVPFPLNYDSLAKTTPRQRRRSNTWIEGLSARVVITDNVVVVGGFYWIDSTGISPYIKTYTSRAYRMQDTNSFGGTRLVVYQRNYADTNFVTYDTAQYQTSIFVETYDPQFYNYFSSRLSGDSPNSSFGLSGSNIKWNVTGDGVGMLIGYASTRKRLVGF
ncbi:MAG: hypothetical protein ABSG15_03250 [FCB group bacterium]